MPDRLLELGRPMPVCGVDEAGRGPLAGPVVAAAVILPASLPSVLDGLNDSKKLSAARREKLFSAITAHCAYAIAEASPAEIDALNIHHATLLAMRRAIEALPVPAAFALVDGKFAPSVAIGTQPVIKGDALCSAIAAASILAKVTRDKIMCALSLQHPGYGWERNAGYPTAEHVRALGALGITPYHRRSFGPVSQQCLLID
jgi:ribonuclease HII